jgi:hypothetical protein
MPNIDNASAISPKTKISDEDYVLGVDVTRMLAAGETATSVVSCALVPVPTLGDPTILPAADSALVIAGTPAVNAAPFNDDSTPPVPVAIGKGIQFELQAGTPPTLAQKAAGALYTRYDIKVIFQTSLGFKRACLCSVYVPA